VDSPILDSTTGRVFWFDGTDTTNNGEVVQTDTALNNAITLAGVGGQSAISPMFGGAFDNTYLTSSPGGVAGFMYFCGKDPTQSDAPALWRVGFNSSGVMNSVPDGGSGGYYTEADHGPCSPITEVYNTPTSTDWIFYSVSTYNYYCPGAYGCVQSLNLTTVGSWPNGYPTNDSIVSSGGTSGIIVDNVAVTSGGNYPQASSIYFSWLAPGAPDDDFATPCDSITSGGCFQKLTQNGLQ
jgi:hypothetical protein